MCIKNIEKTILFGVSVRGDYHKKNNIDCQDAWEYKRTRDVIIISVSDGAGSSKKGGIGAKIAVQSAVKIKEKFSDLNCNLQELAKSAAKRARRTLEKESQEHGISCEEFACTLLVVVIRRDRVSVAHVGDGAVVGELNGKLELISEPEKSEYINETTFLTCEDWESALRITEEKEFNSLAIFTDGIQRGVLVKQGENYIPFEPFFKVLFSYAEKVKDEKKASEEIEKLLNSEKFLKLSSDDKTLVVVVQRDLTNES